MTTTQKRSTIKKLTQSGFGHHFLLPLLAVLIVGGIGLYLTLRSNAAVAAPTKLSVATGGNSNVVIWDYADKSSVARYDIYRDDVHIGSSTPDSSSPLQTGKDGTRYTDRPVTPGATSTYSVVAVTTGGQSSPKSPSVKARAPSQTTPLTILSVDASADPSLESWLTDTIRPEVALWYPKISDHIAYPRYTPPLEATLKLDSTLSVPAKTSGTTVHLSTSYFRAHPDDIGAVIHELAHVASTTANYQRWEDESIADWIRLKIYRDPKFASYRLSSHSFYDQGYMPGARMLSYIRANGNPNIIKDLNVSIRAKAYGSHYIEEKTGKSADAWWAEMTNQKVKTGRLALAENESLCADLPYSNTTYGTDLQLYSCNGTSAQRYSFATRGSGASVVHLMGGCMDVESSGTANGTPIQYWGCNGTSAQRWRLQSNGTLVNPSSGKCLAVSSVASGAKTVLSTCAAVSTQRWVVSDQ